MTSEFSIEKIQEFIDCDGTQMIDIVTLITAQDALRKQIPIKPIKDEITSHGFLCAICNGVVFDFRKRPFCPTCGQAIDWSK